MKKILTMLVMIIAVAMSAHAQSRPLEIWVGANKTATTLWDTTTITNNSYQDVHVVIWNKGSDTIYASRAMNSVDTVLGARLVIPPGYQYNIPKTNIKQINVRSRSGSQSYSIMAD